LEQEGPAPGDAKRALEALDWAVERAERVRVVPLPGLVPTRADYKSRPRSTSTTSAPGSTGSS